MFEFAVVQWGLQLAAIETELLKGSPPLLLPKSSNPDHLPTASRPDELFGTLDDDQIVDRLQTLMGIRSEVSMEPGFYDKEMQTGDPGSVIAC